MVLMEKHEFIYKSTELVYYQSSKVPKLLIASGFHGDETEVVEPLRDIVLANAHLLPPFIFVPVACPSAVALGTRLNKNNVDINRSYYLDSPEEEAQALMKLIAGHAFDVAYSFHEHAGETRFYLYDMGDGVEGTKIDALLLEVVKLGVELYNGVDDLEDPSLGVDIVDGYYLEKEEDAIKHGFFNGYLAKSNLAHSHVNPEIPGAISKEKKKEIVQAIFDTLIFSRT